ncbi:MAG: copper amine oxidase N-terminal domain-containing protein [Armatimonadota bacterium]
MRTARHLGMLGLVISGLLLAAMSSGMAAVQVELNGRPLALSVDPIQVGNRTMVPMRSLFEALGANVQWTDSTQTVTATRNATTIQLAIGARDALVNGRSLALDVPAMLYGGSTMVPLRFVSESLGADVRWNEGAQTVSMFTTGAPSPYQPVEPRPLPMQPARPQRLVIPMGTVVPVSLDRALSSATARVGDRFTVTVRSSRSGDAEFPRGTHFVGTVVDVQRASGRRPGMLDLSFIQVRLPDGSTGRLDGSLISLDQRSASRSSDGRLVATATPRSNDRLKMIGVGVGAGLLIGKLLDKDLLVGGLLGGAAGYLYSETTTDKARPKNVVVKAGTVFGVRMDRDVAYSAPWAFVGDRETYRRSY